MKNDWSSPAESHQTTIAAQADREPYDLTWLERRPGGGDGARRHVAPSCVADQSMN